MPQTLTRLADLQTLPFDQIIDGEAFVEMGFAARGTNLPEPPIDLDVALAGDKPVPVAGFAVSLRGDRAMYRNPADVELFLSTDGENWTRAYTASLAPVWSEQAFALEVPVPARFARLRLLRSFEGRRPYGSLGEFKVIASPRHPVSGAEGLNLADMALGGNMVWSLPIFHPKTYENHALNPDRGSQPVSVPPGQPLHGVVGFQHARAARLGRIEWHRDPDSRGTQPERVQLAISSDSPVGPWVSLGDWDVSADDFSVFELPDTPWVRYLRFTVPPSDERRSMALPLQLAAFEAVGVAGYRSPLGEWGEFSQAAGMEWEAGVGALASLQPRDNTTRESAALLAAGQPEAGRVSQEGDEHWYRYVFPEGDNVATLYLNGQYTVDAALEVQGDGNTEFFVDRRKDLDEPGRQAWDIISADGATVWIRVYEPPRNVVFAWDTSQSVNPYMPVIYSALSNYASDLSFGRDSANLLPFGGGLLLSDWHGSPFAMNTILNDYPRQDSSSEAERTLELAAKALQPRTGTKSIVLITDASTGLYAPMWAAFETTRPRIFSMGIFCTGFGCDPPADRNRFEAWSRVNGGRIDWVDEPGSSEVVFDRAIVLLRRPVSYQLEVTSEFRETPGPGFLVVTPLTSGSAPGDAVGVILDASGSMLQRLDGQRRITIARDMLTRAVTEQIPAGTPFALRVFGHREPNACRTDLVVPLAPLDPAAVANTLADIQAMNLARTPIADSLQKAADDLKAATGRKLILLVTDGEETCDGDPAAVVERLRDAGVTFSLNIVGFAIDDDQLSAEFEAWATAGGGDYLAANDAAGLSTAIDRALRPAFSVMNEQGVAIAAGRLGDPPLAVPQGNYTVVVRAGAERRFENVRIRGEETTTIDMN